MVKITMNQNYFEVDNTLWLQENGSPMGSPVSSMLAEIFLQELETKFYPELIQKRHIKYIARYVDVFIIYDGVMSCTEFFMLNEHGKFNRLLRIT
jgi:hypothetical protein